MTRKQLKEIWDLMTPEQRVLSIEYHALAKYLKKMPKKANALAKEAIEKEMDSLARQYHQVTLDDDKPPPPPPPPPPWW